MKQTFEIYGLNCLCSRYNDDNKRIAYVLYPVDTLNDWIELAATKYKTTIVVITGMDWMNAFSPWKSESVHTGTPDFQGKSPEFLNLMQENIIPQIERALNMRNDSERSLIGVSMSGLFALWQWIQCDIFTNIASLSGSFWYDGFTDWIKHQNIPAKKGIGYFSLGSLESKSKNKVFNCIERNTKEIVNLLQAAGINAEFNIVPGNHFANPIQRLDKAFAALFTTV